MEAKIKEETKERELSKITELDLTKCKSKNVVGLSEDWSSLEKLYINEVGLTTLKGFPRLPNLKKLELKDNLLCEGLDALTCLPKLGELHLSGNKIKDLDPLQALGEIKTLKRLTLKGCDVTSIKDYRGKIFALIPSLEQIDGENRVHDDKVNGDDDDDDAEDEGEIVEDEEDSFDEEEEEDEDEEEGKDIPLQALYNTINEEDAEEEEDDDDFVAAEDDEDEDIDDEEVEEEGGVGNMSSENVSGKTRGDKRKLDPEEGEKETKKK